MFFVHQICLNGHLFFIFSSSLKLLRFLSSDWLPIITCTNLAFNQEIFPVNWDHREIFIASCMLGLSGACRDPVYISHHSADRFGIININFSHRLFKECPAVSKQTLLFENNFAFHTFHSYKNKFGFIAKIEHGIERDETKNPEFKLDIIF